MTETMRAMSATKEGVQLVEIPVPKPSVEDVLVRVVASSVNTGEEKVLEGGLVGRFLHAKTTPLILGWDFSGTVHAVGSGVTDLTPGQPVWGHLEFSHAQTQGAYAEYVTVPRAEIAVKPDDVPFDVAAAAPTVTMTSLQSLRDLGRLGPGSRLLIIGAGGGIGSVSVGIGHRLGAHVTAVCGTKDVDRVEALGPDVVLDRSETDPLTGTASYDVVFDTPGVYSFGRCAGAICKGGAYVTTLPGPGFFPGLVRSMFSSKRCHFVQVASRRADLELVGEWLSEGLQVPIDSRFPVTELGAALSRQKDRGRAGRVVVDVAEGWPAG